jgi:hypothetical protein
MANWLRTLIKQLLCDHYWEQVTPTPQEWIVAHAVRASGDFKFWQCAYCASRITRYGDWLPINNLSRKPN